MFYVCASSIPDILDLSFCCFLYMEIEKGAFGKAPGERYGFFWLSMSPSPGMAPHVVNVLCIHLKNE